MIKLKLLRLLLIISLGMEISCSKYIITPSQIKLPEYGSRQMLDGIRDGCDSAHSSRGNTLYRNFFTFTQNPELISDDEYYDSWYRGYIYCFHIVNRNAFGSIDSFLEPEHSWFWAKSSYNHGSITAWSLDSGVDIKLNASLKFIGEGENWWNNMFKGCKGIYQC